MKNSDILIILSITLIGVIAAEIIRKRNVGSKGVSQKGVSKKPLNIPETLEEIKDQFGDAIARNVEKIYRLETRNFKSEQFKRGYSAGMEAIRDEFPYGWTSLRSMWLQNPTMAPVGLDYWSKDSGGRKNVKFIQFPNFRAAAYTLATVLQNRGNDAGKWFSYNENAQKAYEKKLAKIKTQYT